jgi:hypothetical protein
MRGALAWILVIVAGIAVVLVVTAAIGNRNKTGQTVPAGDYAQTVCGAVGTWRGEIKAIVDEIRTPPAFGGLGDEEPQSETPQGRTGLIRSGLQSSVRATKTLVEGINYAGTPETPQGSAAASQVSGWADASREALEQAEEALENKPATLEEAVGQLTGAAGAIRMTLTSGVKTVASVARLDPQLAAAFRNSSTCQQLRRKEQTSV